MIFADSGYTILLLHLQNPASTLPPPTIQGAVAQHLATASPVPTPFAAIVISSPFFLFQPFTDSRLQSFSTAFRHATHLKYRTIIDGAKSQSTLALILGRNKESALAQWVTDVLKGVQGGHPLLRLAACGGLLLGVEDVKGGENEEGIQVGGARSAVEDEIVLAVAEVMDTYPSSARSGPTAHGVEEWEREFQPAGQGIVYP